MRSVSGPPIDQLWRCVLCQKWSHAERRPTKHQRWIDRNDGLPPEADVVSEVEPYGSGHNGSEWTDGGWFVACGPFEEWRAERVA